jgi:hypothetical protein
VRTFSIPGILKKLPIIGVLVFAFVITAPANATDLVSFDGTWWTSLTDEQQVVAIQGLLSGYEDGYNSGYIAAGVNDVNHYHSTRSQAQLAGDPNGNVHFSKTFGTYQQEVTDFYSQYRSSINVTVGNVMSCLSDDPQFTCAQVSKW